tara:strand:- start:12 stop:308 length:297 start_codon:yes stop_codon:yes gene_type:complete
MILLYILIIYFVHLILSKIRPVKKEQYVSYRLNVPVTNKYRKTQYVKPRLSLPPGTISIDNKFKNKKLEVNQSEYCEDNPTCYPCPNWKHIGAPMCLG